MAQSTCVPKCDWRKMHTRNAGKRKKSSHCITNGQILQEQLLLSKHMDYRFHTMNFWELEVTKESEYNEASAEKDQ